MTDAPALPDDTATLTHGSQMPLLGFGTWQITGKDAVRATSAALEAGYRHLDTATVYGNEGEVGRALAESGVPRDEVFVTTKCPPGRAGRELDTLKESLDLLQTDHVDLWLIHWPGDGSTNSTCGGRSSRPGRRGWPARSASATSTPRSSTRWPRPPGPSPRSTRSSGARCSYDAGVVAAHQARGVVLEGYSALRGGTLDHPAIVEIAERLDRTPAQVIIRWHLQHQVVVIPKSVDPERIRSNADVGGFSLTDDDMAVLDTLAGH